MSRLLGETPTFISPAEESEALLPPFWELEDLIASGLGREAALAVMAARRAGPRLVGEPAPEESFRVRFEPRPADPNSKS
ncbi:hypothetical protein [Bosea thiooxidans]